MRPFVFGRSDRQIFGIYMPPLGDSPDRGAVVLCAPLGTEYINAHRAIRQLSVLLADAGFHTLRFDYFGTGDSGGESETLTLDDLLTDIDLAIDEVCAMSGATRVRLVGLRLGGALAARAAEEFGDRVEAVVLWDPIISGSGHIEEFALNGARPTPGTASVGSVGAEPTQLENLCFPINATFAAEIRALELSDHTRTLPLLTYAVTSSEAEGIDSLRAALANAPGSPVSIENYPSYPCWCEDWPVVVGSVPVKVLAAIVAWMKSVKAPPQVRAYVSATSAGSVAGPRIKDTPVGGSSLPSETIVRIGQTPSMMGILTAPTMERADDDRPGILVLNTGIAHRVGHFRIFSAMARKLAGLGHTVLRFDMSGIGDSERRDDSLLPLDSAKRDIREAIEFMQSKCSLTRIVLIGICSGADNALAFAGNDPRVVGSILIDPTIPPTPRYYRILLLQRLKSRRSWMKAANSSRHAMRIIRQTIMPSLSRTFEKSDLQAENARGVLRDSFEAMVKAEQKILVVITGGIEYRYKYGSQLLDVLPDIDFADQLSILKMGDCDHLFSTTQNRARLFSIIKEWLGSTSFSKLPKRQQEQPDRVEYF